MTGSPQKNALDASSLAAQKRRKELLDRFEAAWRSQSRPRLADFLTTIPEYDHEGLFRELLKLDIDYRQRAGETPQAADYATVWPKFGNAINSLFSDDPDATVVPPTADLLETVIGGAPDLANPQDTTVGYEKYPSSTSSHPQIGRYEILGEIARGGMGVVCKAFDRQLDRLVALKLIKSGELADDDQIQRFQVEAKAAAHLDHPGIVQVYEVGQFGHQHFMAMALIDGHSLWHEVNESPLSPKRAAKLMEQVAEAVQYAHDRGIIHRDLKPQNILLTNDGQPKVTDFGLAKRQEIDSSLTETGQALGTPSYMPPEQAKGSIKDIGPLADVYSLGATLYCLLTGRPPFQAATQLETMVQVVEQEPVSPRQLNPAIPKDLETICLKCLQKDRGKRYASASELAHDLGQFQRGEPISARPVGQLERCWSWCRRNPVIAGLSSSAALLLFAVATVSTLAYLREVKLVREKDELITAKDIANREKDRLADEERSLRAKSDLLVIEKTKLAADQKAARDDAEQKAISLRKALASSHFSMGATECESGRYDSGTTGILRAARMLPDDDPMKSHYRQVFTDRARLSGRLSTPVIRQESMSSVMFSPQGDRVLTQTQSGIVRLWDAVTGEPLGQPMRGLNAALNPQGDTVATTNFDVTPNRAAKLQLWDAYTGEPKNEPMVHESDIRTIAFSPRGDLVLTGCADGTVHLWSALTCQRHGKPLSHGAPLRRVAFSPDGNLLLTQGNEKPFVDSFLIWDFDARQRIANQIPSEWGVTDVEFNSHGDSVIAACRDRATPTWTPKVRRWNFHDGKEVGEAIQDFLSNAITVKIIHDYRGSRMLTLTVAFSPQGDRMLTSGYDQFAQLRQAETFTPIGEPLKHQGSVMAVAFSPDGRRIATACSQGLVQLRDGYTGATIGEPFRHPGPVEGIAFNPNGGDRLLTSCSDGTVRIWNCDKDEFPKRLHGGVYPSIATFSANGDRLLTGSLNVGQVWDATTGAAIGKPMQHPAQVTRVAFSPQGHRAATTSRDNTARLWDANTGEPIGEPMKHDGEISEVMFSPNGDQLLATVNGKPINVWDVLTGSRIRGEFEQFDGVTAAIFHPNRNQILAVSRGGNVVSWDSRSGNRMAELMKCEFYTSAIAFSPQGHRILTRSQTLGSYGQLWDAHTGQPIGSPIQASPISDVAFSHDGHRFLTGHQDGTARLWDSNTGASVAEPIWHEQFVRQVLFNPQGDCLFTSNIETDKFFHTRTNRGAARLWDAATHVTLGEPLLFQGAVIASAFLPDGKRVVAAGSDGILRSLEIESAPDDAFETYGEVITGRRIDSDGNLRILSASEWIDCWSSLKAGNSNWLQKVRIRSDEKRRRFHESALLDPVIEQDLFAQEFHVRWLVGSQGQGEKWKSKLDELQIRKKLIGNRDPNVGDVVDFEAAIGMTNEELTRWISEIARQGACPTYLSTQTGSPEVRYNAIAVKGFAPVSFDFHPGLSSAEAKNVWDQRQSHQRLAMSNFYSVDGETKELQVWIDNDLKRVWSAWSGDLGFVQSKWNEGRETKMRPTHIVGPVADASARFAGMFVSDPDRAWDIFPLDNIDAVRELFERQKARQWRPELLYSYWSNDRVRFLALVVENSRAVAWDSQFDLSSTELRAAIDEQRKNGFRPLSIICYGSNNDPRYSAVWEKYRR